MHRAAYDGNTTIVKMLLDHGADIEATNSVGNGIVVVMVLIKYHRVEILR